MRQPNSTPRSTKSRSRSAPRRRHGTPVPPRELSTVRLLTGLGVIGKGGRDRSFAEERYEGSYNTIYARGRVLTLFQRSSRRRRRISSPLLLKRRRLSRPRSRQSGISFTSRFQSLITRLVDGISYWGAAKDADRMYRTTIPLSGSGLPRVPPSRNIPHTSLVRTLLSRGPAKANEAHPDHEVLAKLDGYDPERGVKVVGHRGYFLRNWGVFLNQYGRHLTLSPPLLTDMVQSLHQLWSRVLAPEGLCSAPHTSAHA